MILMYMTILLAELVTNIACAAQNIIRCLNVRVLFIFQVKSFKDYVELFLKGKEDDMGNPLKCVYENVNPRWEVAVALSDRGFQQMSFVNSIATTKVRY